MVYSTISKSHKAYSTCALPKSLVGFFRSHFNCVVWCYFTYLQMVRAYIGA
ncbi:hypothetical protein [Aeromonas phage Akh-2]|nr:hypothetical protein [Aeromonas phage Akh-2]